ncbi:SMP-30/gluconolactonase/LRE family protein [Sphingobacterium alkalisoli]|uniref:SMP-30/gluconolactonase/LRE family protein n=1 Tax=Sphingobacterium alkalisoli TaxID=1874115 RepID=A0A4U0GUR8_9SPHI|nr:SMP-30/gluconolactonase/LRE family protein [Sphingobacterium alkalisoli]TJY61462.1 SMP-30/gluconolactonase/LRE family protein [Sphingobacterium alkalisoli]GGH30258.1 gluconolactonase [Sphingobacterium alkalisoli]
MINVLLDNIAFPEGPAFDKNGRIWLVEKEAGNLISIDSEGIKRYQTNGNPNGIAIDKNNLIWFCDAKQNSIRTFNQSTERIETIVSSIDNMPLKMPNDLAFDEHENLIFTCPGDTLTDGTGYVCCLTNTKKLLIIKHNMFYPNGLAFSKDFNSLYIAETGTHIIWKFKWNALQHILSEGIQWINVGGPIGPDGIAFDADDNLYIALYGGASVKKVDQYGQIMEEILLPGKNATNCAIDPTGKMGIIITEAEQGTLLQKKINTKGVL